MDKVSTSMRTLTFGERSISYNDANDDLEDSVSERSESDYSCPSSIYPCSDMDSGVGEDVCCEEPKENFVESERKVIKPDLKAIEELTNFDEDEDESDDHLESEEDESENLSFEDDDTNFSEEEDVFSANVVFDTKEMFSRRHEHDDMCLNGFEYHSLGPASLSVLQLNRSELIHMRHVMVKIELDSRLQGGEREVDTMMARLEAGRVCVVCTRTKFSYFAPGLPCSVCQFSICKLCTASPSPASPGSVRSLPASPTPPPSSPETPGSSISTRLGTLFRRRSSVSAATRPRAGVMCRPCSQFVQQMDLMSEEDGEMDRLSTERIM